MDINLLIIINLALTGLTLILCMVILTKLKVVKYLLEQPVVKKLSSKMKLKPYNKGDSRSSSKDEGHSGRQRSGNRQSKPRGERDRDKDKGNRDKNTRPNRGPRGRGPRSNYPARGTMEGNAAADPKESKPANTREPREHKESRDSEEKSQAKGRRPLQVEKQREESKSAPAPSANGSVEKAQPKVEAGDSKEVQHGRRARVKKTPTFDE